LLSSAIIFIQQISLNFYSGGAAACIILNNGPGYIPNTSIIAIIDDIEDYIFGRMQKVYVFPSYDREKDVERF